MIPAVVMPSATRVLVEFFTEQFAATQHFDDVVVLGRTPAPRPDRWLLVRSVGGHRRDVVTELASMTLEGWAGTDIAPAPSDAGMICHVARALLWAAQGTVVGTTHRTTLSRVVDLAGPADLPDPVSGQSRTTCTVQVAMRGREMATGS